MTMQSKETPADFFLIKRSARDKRITPEMLTYLIGQCGEVGQAYEDNLSERRNVSEDVRYCRWDGQAPDGRKHAKYLDGREATPFEGASDQRVRMADMVINERVILLAAAAMRGQVAVKGTEGTDEGKARKMRTLLEWVLRNQLGPVWRRELLRLLSLREGDSPGAAVMGISWRQEEGLEMQKLNLDQVVMVLVQHYGVTPEQLPDLHAMLLDPEMEGALVDFLLSRELGQKFLTKETAKNLVQQLREDGEAEIPVPYTRVNVPEIAAHRVLEDVFVDTNIRDFQRAPVVFFREWLTEVELRGRVRSLDYDEQAVEEALEHEGSTVFNQFGSLGVTGDGSMDSFDHEDRDGTGPRGHYEVVTAYWRAVDEMGLESIYMTSFSGFCKERAFTDRQMCDYRHGNYPGVWFSREHLTNRLCDSRGVAELMMTDQMVGKLLADSFADHTSVSTLPPVKVPKKGRPSISFKPLGIVREDRPGSIEFMNPPAYPASADKYQVWLDRRLDQYWGRPTEYVPQVMANLRAQFETDNFLADLAEVYKQILQLCQQYMTDEQIARITGGSPEELPRTSEEIQGQFDIQITFDPRDLDMEFLLRKAEVIMKYIMPMDSLNTVQRERVVNWLFAALDPALAEASLVPAQSAQMKEIEDEETNFLKIKAGIEPPMAEEGQNFQLRAGVLQTIVQKNPEALESMEPKSRQIFEARMKHLQGQAQQAANAQRGRVLGNPVLSQ